MLKDMILRVCKIKKTWTSIILKSAGASYEQSRYFVEIGLTTEFLVINI